MSYAPHNTGEVFLVDDADQKNMAIDGSIAPVRYRYVVEESRVVHLHWIDFWFDDSTQQADQSWTGGISLLLCDDQDNVLRNLSADNTQWTSIRDIVRDGFDVLQGDYVDGSGVAIRLRMDFKVEVGRALKMAPGNFVVLVQGADLDAYDRINVILHGTASVGNQEPVSGQSRGGWPTQDLPIDPPFVPAWPPS